MYLIHNKDAVVKIKIKVTRCEKGYSDSYMKTLEDIIMKMDQLDSLMYSIETAMLDAAPADAGEKVIRLHNLIYLLWEQFLQARADIDELNGHIEVCNAVYAVNRVREMQDEIERLKRGA